MTRSEFKKNKRKRSEEDRKKGMRRKPNGQTTDNQDNGDDTIQLKDNSRKEEHRM